jgi:2-polyprenyl-6-methoxyphenol hydroxylase-like FAD-dependent oxidoreductase
VAEARVPVRMGTTVESLDDRGDAVEVVFSDGRRGRYDLVVGADGIRPKVRALAFGRFDPKLAGFGSWRAILPCPPGLEKMIWMWGKGKTLGLLPVARGLVYFAGVTKEDGKIRYRQEDLPLLFREKFGSFGGFVPEVLASISSPDQVLYTAMEEVKLPPPWFTGRIVVLGDAAHAATPFWAQGAAMAIEDAILLAQLLAQHPSPAPALEEWMKRRYDRCMFVQEGSFQTGQQIHRDAEDDKPKVFPPPVRDAIKAEAARRSARLAEPI